MKGIGIIIFLLFVLRVNAQIIDSVKLSIHYKTQFKRREDHTHKRNDEKILDIGHKMSKFYSLWETKSRDVRDSVLAQGGTMSDVQNAWAKLPYPRSYDYYMVYKNHPLKGKLTYSDRVFKEFIYEETLEIPQWDILTGDTIIVEYKCQKAKTNFRGRTWTVWFAPDIPISDGPWKLCGLPGLILYAKDSKSDFLFECIQISNGNNKPIKMPKWKYIKCTADELKQMKIKHDKDHIGYLKQFGVDARPGRGPDGKPLVYKERMPVLLEY